MRPFWETQLDEERTSLLQATLPVLRERAQEIAVRQRKQAGASLRACTGCQDSVDHHDGCPAQTVVSSSASTELWQEAAAGHRSRCRAQQRTEPDWLLTAIEEAEFAAEIAAGAEPIPGAPIAQEPTMDEVLEEGLARLQTKPTWKRWQWPLSGQEFNDADSFRCACDAG